MESTSDQEKLFPDEGSAGGSGGNVLRMRDCDQCGKSYAFKRNTSRFCGPHCKDDYNVAQRKARLNGTATTETAPASAPVITAAPVAPMISSAAFKDQPMHVQVAMDLLKERMEEWRQRVCDLTLEVKALTKERDELKAQLADKQHALNGLEEAQPNGMQKFFSSFPTPWIEALAEPIKALAGGLVGRVGSSPMAGISGQLDAQNQQYLEEINTWYGSLPADLQGKVYAVLLGVAKAQDPVKIDETLTRITNLFNNDNPFEQQQASAYGQQQYNAPSMFATVNGVH